MDENIKKIYLCITLLGFSIIFLALTFLLSGVLEPQHNHCSQVVCCEMGR